MSKRKSFTESPYYKYLGPEAKSHAHLVEWLRWTKPQACWHHTVNEGKKTNFEKYLWEIMGGKASVADFLFFDPRGPYAGLALELKPTGDVIYKKDGTPRKDKIDQEKYLQDLRDRNWLATFASGHEEAKKIIEDYYKL